MSDTPRSFTIDKCVLKPSDGSSLKEEYSILGGSPIITYMESVLSPAIGLTVNFFDTTSIVSREGLTGGEYIELTVKSGNDKLGDFEITSEHKMIVNGVTDVQTNNQGQSATLQCIPEELLVNETAKISKKFSGNISDHVKDIMTTDAKGIQTSKTVDEESTSNKYSFIGNFKRPIDIIQWLQPKAAVEAEEGESFGFLFWETLDGYHFKSIATLLSVEPEKGHIFPKIELPIETADKLIDAKGNTSTDTIMDLRRGMYANKTIYVDLETHIKTVDDFKIADLGLETPPVLPKGLEEKPTKLMFRILDTGALQKDSKKLDGDESATEKQQDLAKYQNKSYARTNLLFSSTFEAVIPFNPTLRAGKTVELQFPIPEPENPDEPRKLGDKNSNDPSGIYLVEGLKHVIGAGTATTQLSLIRDTFTVK